MCAFSGSWESRADGREAENFYRSCLDSTAFLVDGALELCAWLAERYAVYIVTNGTSSTQYKRLALSGLTNLCGMCSSPRMRGARSPSRRIFDYCFARMPGILPERTLLVGDSLTLRYPGRPGSGLPMCAWYNPGGQPLPEEVRPDFVVPTLGGVREILERDAEIF